MKAIYFFLFSLCLQAATAQPLQRVAPEQVGMDSRKLMYADEAIETAISNKDIPGAVLAVVRNGKMAYLKAYGNKRIYPNVEICQIYYHTLEGDYVPYGEGKYQNNRDIQPSLLFRDFEKKGW